MKKRFPIQLAKEAILLRDYSYAIELLYPEAIAGSTEAQFLCGYLHFADPVISKDQATLWITQAAEQGHPEANYILACCPDLTPEYAFESPTDKLGWQRLFYAAAHDSAAAQGDLGRFYAEGCLGLSQDLEKSREWRNRAFESWGRKRGVVNPEVFYKLGMMMLEGVGGPQELEGLKPLSIASWYFTNSYGQRALETLKEIAQARKYGISEDIVKYLEQDVEIMSSYFLESNQTPFREWESHLEGYVRRTLKYNLISVPFEDFVAFIFEHIPVSCLKNMYYAYFDASWTYTAAIDLDPAELAHHYIRLFHNPEFLLERYHPSELEQGFWQMHYHKWSIGGVIFGRDVAIEQSEACIRAMYSLFAKLFAQNPLDTSSYMWWDSDFTKLYCPYDVPQREYDESEIQRLRQVMFETLTAILQLDSLDCKAAALHGLGHLPHPDKEKVIKAFLVDHPELADWHEYAIAAIEGDIL